MEDRDWAEGVAKTLGVFLNGSALEIGRRGEEYVDDNFLLLFNAHFELVTFVLPDSRWGAAWEVLTDTATAIVDTDKAVLKAGEVVDVASRSTLVLLASRRVPEEKWAVHE
jgi:glycogen operon protein